MKRVGLITPVVTRVPGMHSVWERSATPSDLQDVAMAADAAGLHHLTCSQHAVVPEAVASARGGTYWDPLATLSYLAAATRQARLVTSVLVLGYQHPLMIAKQYATLDRLSDGRVVLGVGVGSLREEFDVLDVPFGDRGRRADDALATLRRVLTEGLAGFVLDPAPVQANVPVWVGGSSARSLRRAVGLGDGWAPFGLTLEQLTALLGEVERPIGFDVVLGAPRPLDPIGEPDRVRRTLERMESAGATVASLALAAESKNHYVEQVKALKELLP